VSTALTHSLLGGVPLAITLVLIALIWGVSKNRKGPHPQTYKLSDEWTHAPILWAADEPTDHGHGAATGHSVMADSAEHATGHESHGSHGVTIGGGASGKW
jgi:hypothetical protein